MTQPLPVSGLHHVKVPVAELARSRRWYEPLLDLQVQLEFCNDDGVAQGVAYEPRGTFRLALREDPRRAAALAGFNLLAVQVETRADLALVQQRLEQLRYEHTGIAAATLGWMLGSLDPDGIEVKFYTSETHG